MSYWQDLFDKNLKIKLKELDSCIENQSEFSHLMAELIDGLEFEDSDSKQKEEKTQSINDQSTSENNNENQSTKEDKDQNQQNDTEFNIT